MKSFKTFKESIIDAPRVTYAPGVFDNADTSDPKIKASVKKLVDAQIKEFAKEYPVIKIGLVGSILTKRYRNDADLDFNVLFDVPKEKQEEERIRLSKQFLSASNPDNIQGKLIPGTKHPINYYLMTDNETYQDQEDKADAVFDINTNKFIKRPEDYTFDMNLYLKDFQKKVDEIDVVKGELKRDIVDYDELKELKAGDIKNLQDKVNGKLKEIEKDIQDVIKIGDTVDVERRAAFDTDMSPDEIKKYSIKNRLPKNVVYKMLEKYHYLTFWKKCKKILDDGKVTDAEIDSLKESTDDEIKHSKLLRKALSTMPNSQKQLSFIKQLNILRKKLGYKLLQEDYAQSKTRAVQEALDNSKKLIFAFGRFNPPTIGHGKLMREVITQARKNNANHIVYASASQDKRSNPLDVKTKVKFMQKMFPQNKIKAAGGTQRTFMEILKFYNKMYGEIIMIAGSDRITEFQKLADKYNGKDYDYKSIKVISSGERDPDAEGVTGMSASKMRDMAKNGDYRNFKKGIVNLSNSDTKSLFDAVKKGMGINESIENFTNFINNDLREDYHQEKIFNIGDMVEHTDGSKGMIVRRGSNYVSYESDNLVKKAWLYDVSMCEEQLPESPTVFTGTQNWIKRNITQRTRAQSAIKHYKQLIAKGIKGNISSKVAKLFGFDYREFDDMIKANDLKVETSLIDELSKEHGTLNDSYLIGTDEYAQHTMSMTPGQPIQNFRKYTDIIKEKDIEKFKNEDGTIDKYKKRYKERWKEELDKAVQKMKEEL